MRETTCRPLAFCASVSPKRVSPRIAPLTSLSARSSALKSGEEIMGGNGMTSTSSRVFSTSNPPAPMLMGTTRRLRLVGMPLPLRSCSPDESPAQRGEIRGRRSRISLRSCALRARPHSAEARAAPQGGGTTMKVTGIETLHCDAGWRNYSFVKLTTDEGIVGWSEYDEGFGSPGVTAAIEQLAERVVGQDVSAHERIYAELYCVTRPAAGGVVAEAMGAIENALLDAKAKRLGVPCYELLGGKQRDRIRLYWSHCATWRINHPDWYKPAITDLDGVHLKALDDGAGPDVNLMLDLNFNAKTEGYLKILRAIAHFDMFWIEIDTYSAEALGYIRRQSAHPISSCETLFGLREFMPYFREQAMDVAIIDTVWNGVWQSMKIAALAEAHEVNVAPHNFYGHLCTMMNAHFAAAVPNLRIMEIDIDRLAWDDELVTHPPQIEAGHLIVPDRPGWGTE